MKTLKIDTGNRLADYILWSLYCQAIKTGINNWELDVEWVGPENNQHFLIKGSEDNLKKIKEEVDKTLHKIIEFNKEI